MGLVEKKSDLEQERKTGFDFVSRDWTEYGESFLMKRVYCVSAAIRTSRASGRAYVLFNLKDAKGKLFSAYMFNLGEELERKAFKVTGMRGQFLEISGEVGEFQGEPAYYLFEANVTEKLGNLREYLGDEEHALEFLAGFDAKMMRYAEDLQGADPRWALASIPAVMDGKIGAFSRVALEMLEDLERFFAISGMEAVGKEQWVKVFRVVMAKLFDWCQVPDQKVLLGAHGALLAAAASEGMEGEEKVLLVDTLLGVLGLMQPETVLGNLVKDSLEANRKRWKLANVQGQLLVGHGVQMEDGELKLPI